MDDKSIPAGDELARACAEVMLAKDNATRALGMKIIDISRGRAELEMMVVDTMTNGQGHCHGGYIFTLADSAFAFACNGYNQFTVAQHCSIDFLLPASKGDRLNAVATELSRQGRSGIYDVCVTNEKGDVIAQFRGNSRTIKGTHLP